MLFLTHVGKTVALTTHSTFYFLPVIIKSVLPHIKFHDYYHYIFPTFFSHISVMTCSSKVDQLLTNFNKYL